MISFPVHFSFVYKRATSFDVIFLYLNTHKCFHQMQFSGGVFLSFMARIISSANKGTLTSPFPICISFISFTCLLSLAKTSSTVE